jgi:hypothetical protein
VTQEEYAKAVEEYLKWSGPNPNVQAAGQPPTPQQVWPGPQAPTNSSPSDGLPKPTWLANSAAAQAPVPSSPPPGTGRDPLPMNQPASSGQFTQSIFNGPNAIRSTFAPAGSAGPAVPGSEAPWRMSSVQQGNQPAMFNPPSQEAVDSYLNKSQGQGSFDPNQLKRIIDTMLPALSGNPNVMQDRASMASKMGEMMLHGQNVANEGALTRANQLQLGKLHSDTQKYVADTNANSMKGASLDNWILNNPNATPAEIELMGARIREFRNSRRDQNQGGPGDNSTGGPGSKNPPPKPPPNIKELTDRVLGQVGPKEVEGFLRQAGILASPDNKTPRMDVPALMEALRRNPRIVEKGIPEMYRQIRNAGIVNPEDFQHTLEQAMIRRVNETHGSLIGIDKPIQVGGLTLRPGGKGTSHDSGMTIEGPNQPGVWHAQGGYTMDATPTFFQGTKDRYSQEASILEKVLSSIYGYKE